MKAKKFTLMAETTIVEEIPLEEKVRLMLKARKEQQQKQTKLPPFPKEPGHKIVLCPHFKIQVINGSQNFQCEASVPAEVCGKNLSIYLEIWDPEVRLHRFPMLNDIVSSLYLDCGAEVKNEPVSQILSSKLYVELEARNFTRISPSSSSQDHASEMDPMASSCSLTQWSEWTKCTISCGPDPGVKSRWRSTFGSRYLWDTNESMLSFLTFFKLIFKNVLWEKAE